MSARTSGNIRDVLGGTIKGGVFVAVAALALASTATAGSAAGAAQAATPKTWFWSKQRAESVAYVSDLPTGCSRLILRAGWIGKCVAPNYTYGGTSCVGVGPRTISSTADVYLYKTFTCRFATLAWTPAALNAAYQHMAEIVCKKQQNDAAAYDACLQAALNDRVGTARSSGGMGGPYLWLTDAAAKGNSTLHVQVTGRFTALVTWLGTTWKKTIHPTG
jgi:hypothetical protein